MYDIVYDPGGNLSVMFCGEEHWLRPDAVVHLSIPDGYDTSTIYIPMSKKGE